MYMMYYTSHGHVHHIVATLKCPIIAHGVYSYRELQSGGFLASILNLIQNLLHESSIYGPECVDCKGRLFIWRLTRINDLEYTDPVRLFTFALDDHGLHGASGHGHGRINNVHGKLVRFPYGIGGALQLL